MRSESKARGKPVQRQLLAIEPEHIAVDDEKRIIEQRQRLRDPAAGIEQLDLPRDLDAGMSSPREPSSHHVGLVMDVDDDAFDAGQRQAVDYVIEQSAAVQLDKRFRDRVGQRPQAGAEPGGEHHARAQRCGHIAARGSGMPRSAGGR